MRHLVWYVSRDGSWYGYRCGCPRTADHLRSVGRPPHAFPEATSLVPRT